MMDGPPLFTLPADILNGEIGGRIGKVGCTMLFMTCRQVPLYRENVLHPRNICTGIALSGDLRLLKWAREQALFQVDAATFDAAATIGRVDMLIYLKVGRSSRIISRITEAAALNGQLDVLKWVYDEDHRPLWSPQTFHNAILGDHREILRYLSYNWRSRPADISLVVFALKHGRTELAEWIGLAIINNSTGTNEAIRQDCPEVFDLRESKGNRMPPYVLHDVRGRAGPRVAAWLDNHGY